MKIRTPHPALRSKVTTASRHSNVDTSRKGLQQPKGVGIKPQSPNVPKNFEGMAGVALDMSISSLSQISEQNKVQSPSFDKNTGGVEGG